MILLLALAALCAAVLFALDARKHARLAAQQAERALTAAVTARALANEAAFDKLGRTR